MKRFLIGVVAVGIAIVGFAAIAWRPAIAPAPPPPVAGFSPQRVASGEALAGGGFCADCHTVKGGGDFAGGYPIATPFGVIYSTNITPDPATGIGAWTDVAFIRAMREGVSRDGSRLFPAFPYDHFTELSDDDLRALYAFLMTRKPVDAPARRNGLAFPFNIRLLQAAWKVLFVKSGPYEPRADKSVAWNRGAYLAIGLSHCGACHTPRNAFGAEKADQAYEGAVIDSWVAPSLTKTNPSTAPWSEGELFAYLRNGVSPLHGVAAGPMSPVVHNGLAKLPNGDIHALAVYFADVGGAGARSGETRPAVQKALAADRLGVGLQYDPAARLYTAACASCHYNGGDSVNPLRPDLALNSALNLPDPSNLIRVILYGVGARDGAPGIVMPAFARGFDDADVARIAAYLRATRTTRAPWPDLERSVAEIRAQATD